MSLDVPLGFHIRRAMWQA
uniref:Uncharacterized protein n=1 Tax=Arundo donax TaxID=35708 RepID=A0A0A9HJD0_ARUDO